MERSPLNVRSSPLMQDSEIEEMNVTERGKEVVTTNLADVDNKNIADWRKLFAASPDQSLKFFPLK